MSQWEGWHPIYEMENKIHVWNHQPDIYNPVIPSHLDLYNIDHFDNHKFTNQCYNLVITIYITI